MMTLKRLPAFLLVVFLPVSGFSQTLNVAKLDSFFNVLAVNNKTMGSFAVAKNGNIVYQRTVGYSRLANDQYIAADENTVYHIGSITKMFTATMLFQLIEAGKISLTMTLDHYFPEIPNAKAITIGMLLAHKSGLYDYVNDEPDKLWITLPHTQDEILNKIIDGKTHFLPNAGTAYCNSGYYLSTLIIEKITKVNYADNLQSRICSRIGIKHTYSPLTNEPGKDEAVSFVYTDKWENKTDLYFPNIYRRR